MENINKILNINNTQNDIEYDVVVVGAGNGGLISALTCAKKGLKTLLIEQHNLPGGFATSFVRGRFEFETALHELGNFGDHLTSGTVYNLFKELNINIKWKKIPELFCLIYNNKQYTFDSGIDGFINSCENYEKGSKIAVKKFLDICKDCYDTTQYLIASKGNPDPKVLRSKYPNFLTVQNSTLSDILKKINCSSFIKFVIESYWAYLGLPPEEISAYVYCVMFYEYIYFGAYIPVNRSHEISQTIIDCIHNAKGQIWFNTKLESITIKNNAVVGINTSNGYIKTKHVIANISPHLVYNNMIIDLDKNNFIDSVPYKLTSTRTPGQQGFCVYLGLNVSVEKLGLDKYSYFIFSSSNHEQIANNMKKIETNNEFILVALNVANPDCSEKDTSILSLTTLYYDAWNDVKPEEYYKLKNDIALRLIKVAEKTLNINIQDHIEEIEVATPVTFARYTGSLNGAIYGYKQSITDSTFVRSFNNNEYNTITGLRFCGANSMYCHGYSITYVSGNIAGLQTYLDIKKG